MSRPVRIGAIQVPGWVEGDTPQEKHHCNIAQMEELLVEAGERGCDIAGVGEASNVRGIPQEDRDVLYEDLPLLDGPEVEMGSRVAQEYEMNICLGIVGFENGNKRNAAVFMDRRGEIAGVYHKVQPTRGELLGGTVAGEDLPVFELDFGKVGAIICHDMSFVETVRVLGVRGAEIVMWPSNWSGWGEDLSNCLIRSRAIDNHCYIAFLSSGQDPTKPMNWKQGVAGCTSLISPMGQVIAQMPTRTPGIVTADIDLDLKRVAHGFSWGNDDIFIDEMLCERNVAAYAPIADGSLVPAPPREYER